MSKNSWCMEEENMFSYEIVANFGETIGACTIRSGQNYNVIKDFFVEVVNGKSNCANPLACDVQKASEVSLVVTTYKRGSSKEVEIINQMVLEKYSNVETVSADIENLYHKLLLEKIDYILFGFDCSKGMSIPCIAEVKEVITGRTPAESVVRLKEFSNWNKNEVSVMYIYQHARGFFNKFEVFQKELTNEE